VGDPSHRWDTMRGMSAIGELSTLGLVVNPERDDAAAAADAIRRWAATKGLAVIEPKTSDEGAFAAVDLVVSLGGDGTVLRAVQMVGGSGVPVLGVNCGTLGYLTTIEPDEVIEVLDEVSGGSMPRGGSIEERMLLRVEVSTSAGVSHTLRGLNEMVVEKVESGHTVRLEVAIDADHFATYSADGLIVATPTGSVVSPRHRALLITPVSPHMLFDRSLVLDPEEKVHIRVVGTRPVDVAIDGRRVSSLAQGDTVTFSPDTAQAYFIRVSDPKFHQIVRQKFGLGDE